MRKILVSCTMRNAGCIALKARSSENLKATVSRFVLNLPITIQHESQHYTQITQCQTTCFYGTLTSGRIRQNIVIGTEIKVLTYRDTAFNVKTGFTAAVHCQGSAAHAECVSATQSRKRQYFFLDSLTCNSCHQTHEARFITAQGHGEVSLLLHPQLIICVKHNSLFLI